MICLFLKLSKGRILPNAADQAKKVTLKRALLLQEKEVLTWELRHYKMILHQTTLSWKGPTKLVLTALSQLNGRMK